MCRLIVDAVVAGHRPNSPHCPGSIEQNRTQCSKRRRWGEERWGKKTNRGNASRDKRNRETEQKNKGHLTRRWKDKFKSGQRRSQRGQAGRGGEGEEVSHDSNISMWPAVCVCVSVCEAWEQSRLCCRLRMGMLQVLAMQIPCKLLLPLSYKKNLYDADKEHNIFKCLQSLANLTGHTRQGNRLKLKLFGAAAVSREG